MYFKPSYLPYNGSANITVRLLAKELGLSLNEKYEIILASFLAVSKKVNGKAFEWCTCNDHENLKFWSFFPNVSHQSVREVYKLLKQQDFISVSTDIPNYLIESMGCRKPNWIKSKNLPKYFLKEATFIEANLPCIQVNKPESYEYKIVRRDQSRSAPKLSIQQVKQKFGKDYTLAYRSLKELNAYWAEYPLYNPIDDEYYSSARRIFHNGSIKAGGRYYGGWTDISSEQRFDFTIDGHPVVYVKVNAMILSLLSSLTGKHINMIGVYEDLYRAVVFQIPNISNARDKVKQVILELTGTGNPYKGEPSEDSKEIIDDVEEFIQIRDLCLDAYPALKCLDKSKLNFANDLSYHESQILTQTLLKLKNMGIVAYPVNDCVIVRFGDEFNTVETIKTVFKDYLSSYQKPNKLPKLDLDVALKVEFDPSNKVRVQGTLG